MTEHTTFRYDASAVLIVVHHTARFTGAYSIEEASRHVLLVRERWIGVGEIRRFVPAMLGAYDLKVIDEQHRRIRGLIERERQVCG